MNNNQREYIRVVATSLTESGLSPEEALVKAAEMWDRKILAQKAINKLITEAERKEAISKGHKFVKSPFGHGLCAACHSLPESHTGGGDTE